METIKTNIDWFDQILPDGLPIKSTTIITGPGGSGKPLIGEYFLASWLKSGGSIVVMSLQYPDPKFVTTSVKNITGLNIKDYAENVIFIQLNTEIPDFEQVNNELIYANLVKPNVWEKAINFATKHLPIKGPGVLVFASALNLLLFSPTYGDAILIKIKETITTNTQLTYIISVSTSAKKDEIAQLERLADNLIVSRSDKDPFRLYMKVERLKTGHFKRNEIQIPLSADTLNHIKDKAKHSRGKVLPAILRT
jgi:KaiC/GvpD/RAD55 family RecA-like ATPase